MCNVKIWRMKMIAKKFMSLLTASVMCAVSVPAISAADQSSFKANIRLAGSDFSVQSQSSATIKEGSNTLTCTLPKDEKGKSTSLKGIGLLVIDLEDCYYDIGEVKVEEILVDGKPLSFKESAVVYGADDGSDNDNFRIELFNSFGETASAPAFDASSVTVNESVSVKFTVGKEGYSGGLKKVSGNVVAKKNSSSPVALTGFSVSVTLSEKDRNYDPKNIKSFNCAVNGSSFSAELERGIYDVTVSKDGYVVRKMKDVKIGKRNPSEFTDLDLRARGDVNGDGNVDITDVTTVISHVRGVKKFTDPYQLEVADCNADGNVDITDVTSIISHVRGVKRLK